MPAIPDEFHLIAEKISAEIQAGNSIAALQSSAAGFPGQVVFSSSLGKEDQVLTEMIATAGLAQKIEIFSLDTGRLFEETQYLLNLTNKAYSLKIKVYFPEAGDVETLVREKGSYSFFDSVENRKECCFIRKVKPLKRALQNQKIWVTGIRAAQSTGRAEMLPVELDEDHNVLKIHPLFYFTDEELESYIQEHSVPVNELHKKNYPSIGCAPCTSPVKPGDDPRSGRWWWEQNTGRECGLHAAN